LLFGFNARDNFLQGTVTEIGKAVGYRCSNPDCRHPTVAANAKQDGIVTLGVAAHICAASPAVRQIVRENARSTPACLDIYKHVNTWP
jgi:hypothetical protein